MIDLSNKMKDSFVKNGKKVASKVSKKKDKKFCNKKMKVIKDIFKKLETIEKNMKIFTMNTE